MLFAAKYNFSFQQRSVKMGNYLSDTKTLQEASFKVKNDDKNGRKNGSVKSTSRIRSKRSNENAELSPASYSVGKDCSKRFCKLDENNNEMKKPEFEKKVKKIPYLKKFFKLFDDDVIQDFLWNDGCAKISDKYLLSMVYVFFRRADLSIKEYTRFNFFAALFLAHDMEEDDEELKHEIFPWALGAKWKSKYPSLVTRRDNLLKRMKFRCAVSNLTCTEVMDLCPEHPIWKRERQSYHGGATRLYPPEDEEPFRPKGPDGSPIFCQLCKVNTHQNNIYSNSQYEREKFDADVTNSSNSSYSILGFQSREE